MWVAVWVSGGPSVFKLCRTVTDIGLCDIYNECQVYYADGSTGTMSLPVRGLRVCEDR